jgi:DNA polymerase III subunit delta'
MSAPAILGHERVLETFRRSLRQGRLASTFLFTGPPGIGKWTTALYLAQSLLCETAHTDSLAACGACPGCVQVAAETHPDLILVRKPADKNFIPIELFIGDREHRMREGLCHDISLKPFRGGRKVAIIDDADYLNQEGANCLLKTLEEPPPRSVIMLIGSSEQRQLPTIRSRCQIIRFAPLSDAQVARLLREKHLIEDDADADQIARWGEGSLRQALEWADPELQEARHWLTEQLGQVDFDCVSLARQVEQFVDAVGKDVPARRARLRQVIQSAAGFYRGLMRHRVQVDPEGDPVARHRVQQADRRWQGGAVRASRCLTRCLEALSQVDANANLPTLISAWIDDLGRLSVPRVRNG